MSTAPETGSNGRRIDLVDEPFPEPIATSAMRSQGRALNFFRLLAWSPKVGDRLSRLGAALIASDGMTARQRELIILRTGWRTGCEYEFRQHLLIALRGDLVDRAEIAALQRPVDEHPWSSAEAILLEMVDDLDGQAGLSAPTWDRAMAVFSPGQVVDVLTLAGLYRTVAGLMKVGGVPVDDFVPEEVRAIPFAGAGASAPSGPGGADPGPAAPPPAGDA